MNVYEKLLEIQSELKAPKNQKNTFGNYKYRSCEDILEAVKPLCKDKKVVLNITDEIIQTNARYYVKATVKLINIEKIDEIIENTAYARESETKKGMDDSQITGATSSYARKYALNGMFCIDDTKDADTNEFNTNKKEEIIDKKVTDKEVQTIRNLLNGGTAEATNKNIKIMLKKYNKEKLEDLMMTEYVKMLHSIQERKNKSKEEIGG